MTRSFVSTPRYVQGPGKIADVGEYADELGTQALLIIDDAVEESLDDSLEESFAPTDVDYRIDTFGGECTEDEIARFAAIARSIGTDVVIGVGGGKTLDVAKGVRGQAGGRLMTVPTIASTDAPTSGLSVVYTDDGALAGGLVHDERPDVVLVDTRVIAAAPVRWLVSGIGDALATHFEATATERSSGWTFAGGGPSQAGIALADRSYEVLRAHAKPAVEAVEDGRVNDAVEETVEAIILLSGLGFENGGLAAAHAVHDGIVSATRTTSTHGEKVWFGLLVQLVVENRPDEEIEEIAGFAHDIGLPMTLADLDIPASAVGAVAEATCNDGTSIDNQPGNPTPTEIHEALLAADELGRSIE